MIGNKDFELDVLEEAYTSEHWIVRIYKVIFVIYSIVLNDTSFFSMTPVLIQRILIGFETIQKKIFMVVILLCYSY